MGETLWTLEGVLLAGTGAPRLKADHLRIEPGVTAVMGPSGAGKTSLLNLLVEFEEPDEGSVSRGDGPEGFALPLFWVPQDGGLWPHMTAREHVEAVTSPGAGTDVEELFGELDLAGRVEARPDELSMGEKSRLAVARALAADAAVLVMDEPLSHVDKASASRYWDVIRKRCEGSGASLVFATHSPERVLGEAQRVVCLREGRVLYGGPVEELYWRPETRELAECLGEVNWLGPDEARKWLDGAPANGRCCRPEQVLIRPSTDGRFRVCSARFHGSVAEAEVEDPETGESRRFYHRPAGHRLSPGDHVTLKLVLTLLVMLSMVGCGGGGTEPPLLVEVERNWVMPADGPRIPAPRAVTVRGEGELIVLDTAGRALVFGPDRKLIRSWEMPDHEQGTAEDVCVLRDGRIAVADTHYHRVLLFSPGGELLGQFGSYGEEHGQFIYPVGLTEDASGHIYVCEYGGNDRVQKFSTHGEHVLSFGTFGTGREQFQRPSDLVWREGKLYVADALNNRVQVFSDDGEFQGTLSGQDTDLGLRFPYDIALGPDGSFYVAEYAACRVTAVGPDGRLLGRYGSPGRGAGQFQTPWGIAVGPTGRIYVTDTGNRRMVELKL
jgi:ABC-type Fe3+/spermidine/putrescine transport system ATPase subunit